MTSTSQCIVAALAVCGLLALPVATIEASQTTAASKATQKAPAKAPAEPGVALPAAIKAAFTKAYPNATIKHVSKETEGGVTVFEVESMDAGLSRDLIYKADGTLMSYEEQIAESAVPAPVLAAIKARYPKATITLREKTFQGTTISYEFGLKGAPVASVELTPEGKWISPKAAK